MPMEDRAYVFLPIFLKTNQDLIADVVNFTQTAHTFHYMSWHPF